VCLSHIGWHSSLNQVTICHLEFSIADRASREDLLWHQLQIAQDLVDLVFQSLIRHQQNPHATPLSQLLIAGEQHTILGSGYTDELIIIQGRIIQRIIAQDTKPLGQCAKHSISNE
jgi:hypothetical protein